MRDSSLFQKISNTSEAENLLCAAYGKEETLALILHSICKKGLLSCPDKSQNENEWTQLNVLTTEVLNISYTDFSAKQEGSWYLDKNCEKEKQNSDNLNDNPIVSSTLNTLPVKTNLRMHYLNSDTGHNLQSNY